MDDAERVKLIKGVALTALTFNTAYYLSVIHKQKQTIWELIHYGRDLIRVTEQAQFIVETILEDATLTTEAEARINDKLTLWRHDYELMQVPGIAEKTSLLMRSNPSIQGDTMTDQPTPTPQVVTAPPVEKPSRVRNFTANHPKITRAAKLTAAGLGLVVVTRAVTNAQHHKERLEEGLDHAKEAADALSDSVTTNTES